MCVSLCLLLLVMAIKPALSLLFGHDYYVPGVNPTGELSYFPHYEMQSLAQIPPNSHDPECSSVHMLLSG